MLLTGGTEARGQKPVPVPLCPQHITPHGSVLVANRITKLHGVVSHMTALTVQLVCPYMSVGRTVGTLPLPSVVLTSELKSSASLSLHPRGRSHCCLSELLDKETSAASQNLLSVTQLVTIHYTN